MYYEIDVILEIRDDVTNFRHNIEIDLNFLLQVDHLIQLIESPVFGS